MVDFEFARDLADGDDEDEVDEELEPGGAPLLLVVLDPAQAGRLQEPSER